MNSAQEKYIKERKLGMYNPIVGGVPMIEPESNNSKQQVNKEVGRPVGTSGVPQESQSQEENLYSRKNIQQVVYSTESLRDQGYKGMRKKLGKKKLKNAERKMIDDLCESIVLSKNEEDWGSSLRECLSNVDGIENLSVNCSVQEMSIDHGLDLYSAALLYHSNRRG
jgi:hypothetical protein